MPEPPWPPCDRLIWSRATKPSTTASTEPTPHGSHPTRPSTRLAIASPLVARAGGYPTYPEGRIPGARIPEAVSLRRT